MAKPKLTYFDAPVSRGEECRLALRLANIDFEDNRITRDAWLQMKPSSPYGAMPVFEAPGVPPLGQSNAILVLIGRQHGLHPKDDFEAARHEAMMCHVEDLRAHITPSMRMADGEEKKAAREKLAVDYLPTWASYAEKQIAEGPFFAGSAIHVVDLKLFMTIKWFRSGALDHIPANVFGNFSKLNRLNDAVENHPAIKAWYAKTNK